MKHGKPVFVFGGAALALLLAGCCLCVLVGAVFGGPSKTKVRNRLPVLTTPLLTRTFTPEPTATETLIPTPLPSETPTLLPTETPLPTETFTSTPEPTAIPTTEAAEPMPTAAAGKCPQGCTEPPAGCEIKGNINFETGEKIYHVPGDSFYEDTEIDPGSGERWFCTPDEAVANGWRHSKV